MAWSSKIREIAWPRIRASVILLALFTIVAAFARQHWLADLVANLRVQQVLFGAVLLALCLAYRQWWWAAGAAFCLVLHLPWFFPPANAVAERPGPQRVTVTVSNVLSHNSQFDALLRDVLENEPDVFVLLEITSSQANEVERTTADRYPHRIVRPDDRGNFGIGLYSRHPIQESHVFSLNTSIESIDAAITIRGQTYRILGTHPLPPVSRSQFQSRNEHLKQLADHIRQGAPEFQRLPTVLVGDFNVTPWSPYFVDLEAASGLRRASNRLRPTWYVLPVFPLGLVLDHALISEDLTCVNHRIGRACGSDHRSVTVTLAHSPP